MTPATDFSHDETTRLKKLLAFERKAYKQGYRSIAGIDEAGRGPLAGPVVAAVCILPKGRLLERVNDSKKLTSEIREQLFEVLTSDPKITYSVGIVDSVEIDRINIYQATIQAMRQAINNLESPPDCLLVDGLSLDHLSIPCTKIIKGDQLSLSIAAASIIAKVTRDRLMRLLHLQWPVYGFDQHKGYGTPKHLEALDQHGPCPIHRRSFEPVRAALSKKEELFLFSIY